MATTPNFSIPVYTGTDTAKLDTLLNGQATALDTNLKTALDAIPKAYRTGLDAGRTSPVGWTPAKGDRYYSTDTNLEWYYNGSTWEQILSGPAAWNGNPGAAIAGVTVPAAAAVYPRGLIVKTGMLTSTTSTSFGNEYMPSVTFATPFPTSLLSLSFVQVQQDGATMHPNLCIDGGTKTSFRAMYAGTTSTTKRSFMWTALGY